MEIENNLTVIRGEGKGDNGSEGEEASRIYIKDPQTKTLVGVRIECGRFG